MDNSFGGLASDPRLNVTECNLAALTTLRIGGRATVFTPQNSEAFIYCLQKFQQGKQCFHILGNGSNLLVNDSSLEIPIIHTKLLKGIHFSSPYVEVDAGYMMPKLVNDACTKNLGGIEYLASIPGTVGGGLCMNAGRGKKYNKSIHQRVVSVRVFDGVQERCLTQKELKSDYRWSLFCEEKNVCVLSVVLKLDPMDPDKIRRRILDRMKFTRTHQDHSAPNAGSVFRVQKNFRRLRGLSIGNASFSKKTHNWILNRGASFKDVLQLIQAVGTKDELEWVIWTR